METNDFKDIWKSEVDKNIRPYSEKELNEMIVKSAKKSMRRIQPTGIFQLVVFAVVLLIIYNLTFRNNSMEINILDVAALLILAVAYGISKYRAYKMNKYRSDMPIREWLEYRIKEVEKSIRFSDRYDVPMYGLSLLAACGFYGLYVFFSNAPVSPFISGGIVIGLIIYIIIVRRSLNRNYNKALRELKELYKQFEE